MLKSINQTNWCQLATFAYTMYSRSAVFRKKTEVKCTSRKLFQINSSLGITFFCFSFSSIIFNILNQRKILDNLIPFNDLFLANKFLLCYHLNIFTLKNAKNVPRVLKLNFLNIYLYTISIKIHIP